MRDVARGGWRQIAGQMRNTCRCVGVQHTPTHTHKSAGVCNNNNNNKYVRLGLKDETVRAEVYRYKMGGQEGDGGNSASFIKWTRWRMV